MSLLFTLNRYLPGGEVPPRKLIEGARSVDWSFILFHGGYTKTIYRKQSNYMKDSI